MKTNSLRELIQTKLKTVTSHVYYAVADDSKVFPHIVFTLESINTGDLSRSDYDLVIDVWNKGEQFDTEEMADAVENLLKTKNFPQTDILPTFFSESRKHITDEDKRINHLQLSFIVQLYES